MSGPLGGIFLTHTVHCTTYITDDRQTDYRRTQHCSTSATVIRLAKSQPFSGDP